MRLPIALVCVLALSVGCGGDTGEMADAPPLEAQPSLGIDPAGATEIQPDLTQVSEELQEIYAFIDENVDDHVLNLQRWIQQPSISNTGEGIPETAQMVKGFFDQLGCVDARVFEMGVTEYGAQGNPVVYADCDVGAERTVLLYWMYDTMPITQPDLWNNPPFEGRIVEQAPFPKVMVGRGAANSKGPQIVQWNALMAAKEVTGTLPVNVIFVAEGDEERMSLGLHKFVTENPELIDKAEAMYRFGGQSAGGRASVAGSSEGCVNFELITSGATWGRGPVYGDIHGAHKRQTDSPAWRHIEMLESLLTEDGNGVEVEGFYENMVPLRDEELAYLESQAEGIDLEVAARNTGVARFMTDDPLEYLKLARYGISWNMDGIFGGNMYGGGAGAILPSKITAKVHIRYVPEMDGIDLANKVRAQLDKNGYEDVEMNIIGNVPYCQVDYNTEIAGALTKTYDIFGIPYNDPPPFETMLAGFWPAYLFNDNPVQMPLIGGGAGHGGGSHANNEYYVIEGAGRVYGIEIGRASCRERV